MFLNIQIDLIILKTYDQQFTLTTKKSLHIIFKYKPGLEYRPGVVVYIPIESGRYALSARH